MLTEHDDIDKLFLKTLGEYEKRPPVSVWTNIEKRLDQRSTGRIIMLRTISIAAAIVLVLLAGWWMTNPEKEGSQLQNSIVSQGVITNKTDQPKNITLDTPTINTDKVKSPLPSEKNQVLPSKVSSLAAFAANTTFIGTNGQPSALKPGERILLDSEKVVFENLEQKFKVVKKITEWIADKVSDDTIRSFDSISKSPAKTAIAAISLDKSTGIQNIDHFKKISGRWSLKAEVAPVFNRQAPNNGQQGYLNSGLSQNYSPQKTTSENTFSAGIVAGYKVSKRLIIKSGMIIKNIRQTTSNADFMGMNNSFIAAGNTLHATTPTGLVTLNASGANSNGATLISDSQITNTSIYSGNNVLKQNMQFVEIPVHATYKLINSKMDLGVTGGISTNILVGNKALLSGSGDLSGSGETANMRNVVYSGEVGLEIGYQISNRLTLTIEPRLKHYINSLSTSKSVNYKPQQMEIATGLTYCFN